MLVERHTRGREDRRSEKKMSEWKWEAVRKYSRFYLHRQSILTREGGACFVECGGGERSSEVDVWADVLMAVQAWLVRCPEAFYDRRFLSKQTSYMHAALLQAVQFLSTTGRIRVPVRNCI